MYRYDPTITASILCGKKGYYNSIEEKRKKQMPLISEYVSVGWAAFHLKFQRGRKAYLCGAFTHALRYVLRKDNFVWYISDAMKGWKKIGTIQDFKKIQQGSYFDIYPLVNTKNRKEKINNGFWKKRL